MKYMLMLVRDDDAWEAVDRDSEMAKINGWFGNLARQGKLTGGEQLQERHTATTIRFAGGNPMITDGPFLETKETIGGFGIIDVADLDEALRLARTWPAVAHTIEIRPLLPRQGDM
jgi:hypothetical protein